MPIKLKYVGRDDGQKMSCEVKTTDIVFGLERNFSPIYYKMNRTISLRATVIVIAKQML